MTKEQDVGKVVPVEGQIDGLIIRSRQPESEVSGEFTYGKRIAALAATKLAQTQEKQKVVGAMDYDDWALILPPPDQREIVETISGSGIMIRDVRLKGFEPKTNYENGGWFGPGIVGENLRTFLEIHPTYVDPESSLAGGYRANFSSYRGIKWNPEYDYSHLKPEQEKYGITPGIGGGQHFCQDLEIGLSKGWGQILREIMEYKEINGPEKAEFYDGLENTVLGIQAFIGHHVQEARAMALSETNPLRRKNLEEMAEMNERLMTQPPQTFREACQWTLWFQTVARLYNGSGSLGRMDVVLKPFYDRDKAEGRLTDEEATFHLASLLVRDTAYIQLGGPDSNGNDVTNPLSYLVLEAAHKLKIPANIGVCVGKETDPGLLRRAVEIQFQDKTGIPKFLGIDQTIEGFVNSGYPIELARERAYAGCHWSAIPGKEYTMADMVKINFAAVMDVALREMLAESESPSVIELKERFNNHLQRAVEVVAEGLDFHIEHQHEVFPELVLDLLCHGPIERGLDASQDGGVDYINLGVDGSALATVADSFAAIEQRIEIERKMTWQQLKDYLETDWEGSEGERARLMMKNVPHFGSGGSIADGYAEEISRTFTKMVAEKPTPRGHKMIPGQFSWALMYAMGKDLGPTANGRHKGEPISHGANPDPGFRRDGAPTALAEAVAKVQSGYGNASPLQLDFEPLIANEEHGVAIVEDLIRAHFESGGTQINMNVMDAKKIREAYADPNKYPDLVVRVTGFSAYFSSLSPEFRKLVVERMLTASQ